MQLSLHADYSCRTLMFLALKNGGEKSSIDEIAQAYGISSNHLIKIVHKLGQLGFIETTRGRGGGIRLGRAPEDIRIGDVIRKTEPSLALVECFNKETNTCRMSSSCGLKPWLARAMNAFLKELDDVTLAEVVSNRVGIMNDLKMPLAEEQG